MLLSGIKKAVNHLAFWRPKPPAPPVQEPQDEVWLSRVATRYSGTDSLVAQAMLQVPREVRPSLATLATLPQGPLSVALATAGLKAWHLGESLAERAAAARPFLEAVAANDSGTAGRMATLALQVDPARGAAASAATHAVLNMLAHPLGLPLRDMLIRIGHAASMNAGFARDTMEATRPFLAELSTEAGDARTRRLAQLAMEVPTSEPNAAGGTARAVFNRLIDTKPLLLKNDLLAVAAEASAGRVSCSDRVASADPFLRHRARAAGPEAMLLRTALSIKPETDARAASLARKAVLKRLESGAPLDLPRDYASVGYDIWKGHTDPSVQVLACRPFLKRLSKTHEVARLALESVGSDVWLSRLYGSALQGLLPENPPAPFSDLPPTPFSG